MQTYSHRHHHHEDREDSMSKKEHMKKIMDEENLDSPQDSVEFLEYVKKHQNKVDHHKRRLHRFSRFMFVLGVSALGYMAFRYFVHSSRMHETSYSGRNHRLGASSTDAEADAYKQTFSFVSVAIWGLVVTKAKAGVEAAQNKDASTVSGLVKKVGAICALIAAASIFQLMGSMKTPESEVAKAPKASTHKLQASNERHPASYYDKQSSHYMGGAHNVLINHAKNSMAGVQPVEEEQGNYGHNILINAAKQFSKGEKLGKSVASSGNYGHNKLLSFAESSMSGDDSLNIPSQKALGGSHNVAMAVLSEQSRKFKQQQRRTQQVQQSGFSSFFSGLSNRNLSEKQFNKNLRSTVAFVGFMITLASCVAFYVTLKTYHAHLQKRDQLIALLKNPNARVAVGKKGKEVVKKLAEKSKSLKAAAEPKKKVAKADDIEALIESAKAKKAVNEARSELLLSGYQAPKIVEEVPEPQVVVAPIQPTINYQLIEPMVQAKPVLQQPAPQQQFFYPQNFEVSAPLPVPQMYTQPIAAKVAIQQPEPMREPLPSKKQNLADVPKGELIKALMA